MVNYSYHCYVVVTCFDYKTIRSYLNKLNIPLQRKTDKTINVIVFVRYSRHIFHLFMFSLDPSWLKDFGMMHIHPLFNNSMTCSDMMKEFV